MALLGGDLALRMEFVAQVVERVFLAAAWALRVALAAASRLLKSLSDTASRRRRRVISADKSGIMSSALPSVSTTAVAVSWRLATS
jgi:hypothetical protein